MFMQKQLPQNIEAEVIVLGILLNVPEQMSEVADMLFPKDFYRDAHCIIYEGMLTLYRKNGVGPDFLVLCDYLESTGQLDNVGGAFEISGFGSAVLDMFPMHVDLINAVQLILAASVQRTIIAASVELAKIGFHMTDPQKARDAVEKLLYELTMAYAPPSDFTSLTDIVQQNIRDIEIAYNNRGTIMGVPSGFTDVDRATNGFQRSDFIILAARPSVGKTSLAMSMVENAAKSGKCVAVFSLEMSNGQLGLRLISRRSRINSNSLRSGWIEEEGWDKIVEAGDYLSDLPIWIDDTSGTPITAIRSKLRRLKARTGKEVDLVVIDYIGLMEPDGEESSKQRENRTQEISKISRSLKAIAREFNVPVLALSQLSRAVESRSDKIPQLSDLRDSGSIEQDADLVMFIYREELYNPETVDKGIAQIIIAKHRNGPVGQVALFFDGATTSFHNLEDRSPCE